MLSGRSSFLWALSVSCAIHGALLAGLDGRAVGNRTASAAAAGTGARLPALQVVLENQALPTEILPAVSAAETSAPQPVYPFEVAQTPALGLPLPFSLPLLGEPEYYPLSELTVPPQARTDIPLMAIAGDMGAGPRRMVLVVYLSSLGFVERTEVESSDLPPNYQEAAVQAFRNSLFEPGEKDGRKVNSRVRIEINYE